MSDLHQRALHLRPGLVGSVLRGSLPLVVMVGLALALQLLVKPWLGGIDAGDFYAKMVLDVGTAIILAVSLTMVNGFTGQFSIGHAAFMAVGAYAAAAIVYYGSMFAYGNPEAHAGILSTMGSGRTGVSWFTTGDLLFVGGLIGGGLVAALCGFVVGLPSLRLKGDYLAIVTLGFGEIVRVLIQQSVDVLYDVEEVKAAPVLGIQQVFTTPKADWSAPLWACVGGPLGFSGLPFYTSLFWVFLFAGITLIVAYRLKVSSYGRAFLSIREDEVAAEAMGVKTTSYKVWAFVIAAFFAGIGGGLFAHTVGVQLNPAELGFQKSFDIIIMVVLGGLGSISGAAMAAVILTILPELLRAPPSAWPWGLIVLAPALAVSAVRGGSRPLALGVLFLVIYVSALASGLVGVPWEAVLGGMALLAVVILVARQKYRPLIVWPVAMVGWEGVRWVALVTGTNLADYRMVIYALCLILMMILRPQGLLGVREVWDRVLWVREGARGGKA